MAQSKEEIIREIEDYFVNTLGTDGGPGGGDETAMPGLSKAAVVMQELRKLKDLTYFDVKKAKDFADFLKAKDGQKLIFFFFQKRTMPIPPNLSDFDKMELVNDISFNS